MQSKFWPEDRNRPHLPVPRVPFAASLLAIGVFGPIVACSSDGSSNGGGTGGVRGTGGTSASGGATGSGGAASASGGAPGSTGGATASGGTGEAGSGGATSTGGASASGGKGGSGSGGSVGSGGSAGKGSGGSGATGGKAGSGGSGPGGSRGTGGSAPGGSTGSGGTGGAPGCSSALKSGDTTQTIMSSGASRTFVVHVPPSAKLTAPLPVIFDFHPRGGTGSQQEKASGWGTKCDTVGCIAVFPDSAANGGMGWNVGYCCQGAQMNKVDDVQYLKVFGVGVEVWRCLVLLAIHGSITAQQVSQVMGMDKAAVSRCFKILQAKGLTVMGLNASDGRLRIATLTPKGRALHEKILEIALERERALLSVLSAWRGIPSCSCSSASMRTCLPSRRRPPPTCLAAIVERSETPIDWLVSGFV